MSSAKPRKEPDMPILFGYDNHRLHGVPMRSLRSGKQMQRDVDLRHAWENLMAAARAEPALAVVCFGVQVWV